MTYLRDPALLAAQLDEALAAVRAGHGDPFEVAVLAGLLAREQPDAAALDRARAALSAHDAAALVPGEERQQAHLDRLNVIDDDEPAAVLDALQDLDELCAGAALLGQAAQVAEIVDLAVRALHAFPSPFVALARYASAVLQDAPPAAGDPARRLWRAVEAAPFQEDPLGTPPCLAAQQRLGLRPRVSLAFLPPREAVALQASGRLPPAPQFLPLFSDEELELALTLDPQAGRVLVLRCREDAPPRLLRVDAPTAPLDEILGEALAPGLWRYPAVVGAYRLQVSGRAQDFEVTE